MKRCNGARSTYGMYEDVPPHEAPEENFHKGQYKCKACQTKVNNEHTTWMEQNPRAALDRVVFWPKWDGDCIIVDYERHREYVGPLRRKAKPNVVRPTMGRRPMAQIIARAKYPWFDSAVHDAAHTCQNHECVNEDHIVAMTKQEHREFDAA